MQKFVIDKEFIFQMLNYEIEDFISEVLGYAETETGDISWSQKAELTAKTEEISNIIMQIINQNSGKSEEED